MPTKITLIYDHPQDPDAFEAGYPDQLALAAKLPGIDRLESSKAWPKQDGTPTPAYRVLDLYFTDYDTGGVRIILADIERVTQRAGAVS
jgi:hypothetical protein